MYHHPTIAPERVGCEVRVLNSAKLPYIWDSPTKTDREDAMKLAHLVEERRDEKLPIVALPSEKEMQRRQVVANYEREMKGRTKCINRLHALFLSQGITTLVKKDLANAARRAEAVKQLSGTQREEAEYQLKHLELYEQRAAELKAQMIEESKADEDMERLQTIVGVGPVTAYAFISRVGDGSRFSSGAQVSNYLGFVPRLDYSGCTQRQGHITKRGNGHLRGLVVQAAWSITRSNRGGSLRERYINQTVHFGKSKKKTIVAIGRRLTELMFSILKNKTVYVERGQKKPLDISSCVVLEKGA